jgi:hypothetical protein
MFVVPQFEILPPRFRVPLVVFFSLKGAAASRNHFPDSVSAAKLMSTTAKSVSNSEKVPIWDRSVFH